MIKSAVILFLATLVGGSLAFKSIKSINHNVKHLLVFAGSFLFSITIIHILPELFVSDSDPFFIGLFILLGFFFQKVLEYFTQGVEHGHFHSHDHDNEHPNSMGISLMIALCFHAFLEATLLAHAEGGHMGHIHAEHDEGTVLAGIVLHKIPAALALMSVMSCKYKSRKTQIAILLIFAFSSPIGIFAGYYVQSFHAFSHAATLFLFAFVAGNFLHISTTIFIESSPEHRWNAKKMLLSLVGALVAVASELLMR